MTTSNNLFNHFNAPAQVTSSCYRARQLFRDWIVLIKEIVSRFSFDVGRKKNKVSFLILSIVQFLPKLIIQVPLLKLTRLQVYLITDFKRVKGRHRTRLNLAFIIIIVAKKQTGLIIQKPFTSYKADFYINHPKKNQLRQYIKISK